MYPIGLSSCGFPLTEENFAALHQSHISAIEISMKPELYPHINYKEVAQFSRQYEVVLWSYHLPFVPFEEIEISALDPCIREHTVRYFTELIQKGSDIGIDKFVIHPSGEPIDNAEREDRMKYAMESLDTLAEAAQRCGACVAVEDLPRTCLGNTSDDIRKLISVNDKLRVCFDTNHLLGEDNLHFMKQLADKIITVHISDYDFVNERHWLPGEGKLDWTKMVEAFWEIGYNGVWLYELGLKIPKTILRQRELTFDDFYNNAISIFANHKPPILSKPKENLGMWE